MKLFFLTKPKYILIVTINILLLANFCLAQTNCDEIIFPTLPAFDQQKPIFGLTITDISDEEGIICQLKELRCKNLNAPAPVIRIVFDYWDTDTKKEIKPEYYRPIIKKIKEQNLAYVMGELFDSAEIYFCQEKASPEKCYEKRTQTYYNSLKQFVDIWEIGNEVNGKWVGSPNEDMDVRESVAKQISAAYKVFKCPTDKNKRKECEKPTALTFYFNDDEEGHHSWSDDDEKYSMTKWAEEFHTRFPHPTYVFISYYQDEEYEFQNHTQIVPTYSQWVNIFVKLHSSYPTSKLGFGEVGAQCHYLKTETTHPPHEPNDVWKKIPSDLKSDRRFNLCVDDQIEYINRYYNDWNINIKNALNSRDPNIKFVGGYFYWYFYEDAVSSPNLEVRSLFQTIFTNWIVKEKASVFANGFDQSEFMPLQDNLKINVLQEGDTSNSNPYTIVIVNNPAYLKKKKFKRDPINDQPAKFNASVDYIYANLFGNLPGQTEKFLADETIRDKIRVISIWKNDLEVKDGNTLVKIKGQFESRQNAAVNFFASLNKSYPNLRVNPDVVFAVTAYEDDELEPSAYWSIDDTSKGGIRFTFDGREYTHCFYSLYPGMIAIHADHRGMRALHEFSHAASSSPNGYISDLYNDNDNDLNTLIINRKIDNRYRINIPADFGVYNDFSYKSDLYRDEEAMNTIHAERLNTNFPALMDNYNRFPEQSQHDKLTRQFLLDRIRAKTSR